MAKPTSGGAGGSGGRKRTEPPPETYREYSGSDSAAIIGQEWEAQFIKNPHRTIRELNEYQSGSWVNYALRNPYNDSAGRVKEHTARLDSAMSTLEENTILYRGTLLPGIDAIVSQFGMDGAVGKVINDKGYISTSYDKAVGEEFRKMYAYNPENTLLRIRAPKGTKGVYMDPNSDSYGYQRELVLARNTGLKIVSIKKIETGGGYYDIEAEAVQGG